MHFDQLVCLEPKTKTKISIHLIVEYLELNEIDSKYRIATISQKLLLNSWLVRVYYSKNDHEKFILVLSKKCKSCLCPAWVSYKINFIFHITVHVKIILIIDLFRTNCCFYKLNNKIYSHFKLNIPEYIKFSPNPSL